MKSVLGLNNWSEFSRWICVALWVGYWKRGVMGVEWSVFLSENIKYEIMTGLRESWSGVKDQIYKDLSYKRITLDECLWRDVS